VIKEIILAKSEKAVYEPEKYIESSVFDKSRLFSRSYDSFVGEDMITFNENGNLKLSEIDASYTESYTDSEGNSKSRTITIFKGIFAVATFPFSFDGITTLYPKTWTSGFAEFEDVKLESSRFMEIWTVKSNNQVGARMALGTDIMNNLLYFKESNKDKNITVSFIENQIFIAIDQNTFLEPNYKISVLDQESVKTVIKELKVIQSIVDTFKLKQNVEVNLPNSINLKTDNNAIDGTNKSQLDIIKNQTPSLNNNNLNKNLNRIVVICIVAVLVFFGQLNTFISVNQQAKATERAMQIWDMAPDAKKSLFDSIKISKDKDEKYALYDNNNIQIGENKYVELKKLEAPYNNIFKGKRDFEKDNPGLQIFNIIARIIFFWAAPSNNFYDVLIYTNGNELANSGQQNEVFIDRGAKNFDEYVKYYPRSLLSVGRFENGHQQIKFAQGVGKIDSNGQFIIAPYLTDLSTFKEGLGITYVKSGYGYVNAKGDIVISPKFEYASEFKNGFATVKSNGLFRFIDKIGNFITDENIDVRFNNFKDRFAIVKILNQDSNRNINCDNGLIDITGKLILQNNNFCFINAYGKDKRIVVKNNNNSNIRDRSEVFGVLDFNNNIVVSPKYSKIDDFKEGKAVFTDLSGKEGVVDTNGNETSKAKYSILTPLTDDISIFETLDKNKGLINGNEKVLIYPGEYGNFILQDDNIIRAVKIGFSDFEIYDFNGIKLVGNKGKNEIFDGMRRFISGAKFGFTDSSGNVMVQPIYYNAKDFSEGFAAVTEFDGGLYGFIVPAKDETFRLKTLNFS
jgi:Protein of unknown function (DUF3137)/WG containing repeat